VAGYPAGSDTVDDRPHLGREPVGAGKRPSRIDPNGMPTRWMPSDPGGFVAVLTGLRAIADTTSEKEWPVGGAFESVPLICRANGDNEAFVALYRAMCQRRSIDIEYRAKAGPRSWCCDGADHAPAITNWLYCPVKPRFAA
jgi:hypothetical protein